jgi:hypothetical protein
MNKRLFNMAKSKNRDKALDDGFYDGRFRPKTQDTKKQKEKRRSGKGKSWNLDDDM